MAALNSKLSLLDQANIDTVEARLQSVMHKLSQIAEKKNNSQDNPEKQQKVSTEWGFRAIVNDKC